MLLTASIILLSIFIAWLAFGGRRSGKTTGTFLSCRRISGLDGSDYLIRRYLLPRNQLLNIYLHKFLGSDDDRALHDHPWVSMSIVLKGQLIEHRPNENSGVIKRGKITFRTPRFQHRIELPAGETATTIFITGPVVRTWGFVCPQGWMSWKQYQNNGRCE